MRDLEHKPERVRGAASWLAYWPAGMAALLVVTALCGLALTILLGYWAVEQSGLHQDLGFAPPPAASPLLGFVLQFTPLPIGSVSVGLLLTGLLCALVRALTRSRVQALEIAQRMTRDLRESEAEARKLALVARHTDNAVIITDAVRRIEWVNEGFSRITGYQLAEVQGLAPGKLLQGPETDPAAVELMRRRLNDGLGFRVEIQNYSKDG
ncbi:MAG TPA: PAS domain-containing protein, partial [Chthoniobacterales bacterium]|nr:PAS domain-containing protein [Chthoniobacterales bacterium]